MHDPGGAGFVGLMVLFTGCVAAGGLATVAAALLEWRGRPAAARVAARWAAGLGAAAALSLLGAGALFVSLSR